MRPHESLHRPDMKDVGFEEPASEALFDIRRDVWPSDLDQIRKKLTARVYYYSRDYGRDGIYWDSFTGLTELLQAADPAFNPEQDLDLHEYQGIDHDLQDLGRRKKWYHFARLATLALTIYNRRYPIEGAVVKNKAQIHDALQSYMGSDFPAFVTLTNFLHTLDPQYDIKSGITPENKALMREELQLCRRRGEWWEFAVLANFIHAIDATFDLDAMITAVDRQAMQDSLSRARKVGTLDFFVRMALAMNELSKTMKSRMSQSASVPLPATKKF